MTKGKDEISDKQLVADFLAGSVESYEQLMQRYETNVYNLAMRLTRNPEDAEEVLNDVFITVYRKIDSFQGKSAFSSWLYRVTVNSAYMKLRKRKQKQTISLEDLAPAVRAAHLEDDRGCTRRSDEVIMNNELRTVLQKSINKLPDQYRAVFILRDVDGLSNQEVAEVLNLSIPAVKSRLHRSRLMLRRKLRVYFEDTFSGSYAQNDSEAELGFEHVA